MPRPTPSFFVAVTEFAPAHPCRAAGRRFALVLHDLTVIPFVSLEEARALILRERLVEVTLAELYAMRN